MRHAQVWFWRSWETTLDLFRALKRCVLSFELDRDVVRSPWLDEEETIFDLIQETNRILITLEDLCIANIIHPEDIIQTLALLHKGDFLSIAREAVSLSRTGKWPVTRSRRGLRWLIRQIHGRQAFRVLNRLEKYSVSDSAHEKRD